MAFGEKEGNVPVAITDLAAGEGIPKETVTFGVELKVHIFGVFELVDVVADRIGVVGGGVFEGEF